MIRKGFIGILTLITSYAQFVPRINHDLSPYFNSNTFQSQQVPNQDTLPTHRWPSDQINLRYCLIDTGVGVRLDVFDAAFKAWNENLPPPDPYGLSLTFTGPCPEDLHTITTDIIMHQTQLPTDSRGLTPILIDSTGSTSPGTTYRRFTFDANHGMYVLQPSAIILDANALPYTGIFYNVLLHELGHVIGCDHPLQNFPGSDSVMGYRLTLDSPNIRIKSDDYIFITGVDMQCVSRIYTRSFPLVHVTTTPKRSVPAWSALSPMVVPETIHPTPMHTTPPTPPHGTWLNAKEDTHFYINLTIQLKVTGVMNYTDHFSDIFSIIGLSLSDSHPRI